MGVDLPVQLLNHRTYEDTHVAMRRVDHRASGPARADWLQHL
jgi:hypothetical protein